MPDDSLPALPPRPPWRARPSRRLGGRARHGVQLGVGVAAAAAVALVVVMAIHPPYAADSPTVRVTVSAGCPRSLGNAADVANPAGPSWISRLLHYPPLAPAGATSGVVCYFGTAADGSRTLTRSSTLSTAQAAAISAAAHGASTKRPRGKVHCPAALGSVAIVVLGYPKRPDLDIWWNTSGCQQADNGHVEVFFYGVGLSGTDFAAAVEQAAPAP